jgi:hypothetical protein
LSRFCSYPCPFMWRTQKMVGPGHGCHADDSGQTNGRTMVARSSVTWMHCSVCYELPGGKMLASAQTWTRLCVRADKSASAQTRLCVHVDTSASVRKKVCPRGRAYAFPPPCPSPSPVIPRSPSLTSTRTLEKNKNNFFFVFLVARLKREENNVQFLVFNPQDPQAPRAPRASGQSRKKKKA